MDLDIVGHGLLLGVAIAAPVGPIGMLVIRRSLAFGMAGGLSAGLGAAVADATYAAVAALGITAGAGAVTHSLPFRGVSAVILGLLTVSTLRSRPPVAAATAGVIAAHGRTFASTIALTLANPTTIASFAAASAASGVAGSSRPTDALAFSAAVFLGSVAWWVILSGFTSAFRKHLGEGVLRAVRVAAGLLLAGFAVKALFP